MNREGKKRKEEVEKREQSMEKVKVCVCESEY